MNIDLLTALALSLVLTLALEIGFFLLTGKRDKKDLLLLLLANILTNPVVVLSYWLAVAYAGWNRIIVIVPLEMLAIFTEGYFYSKYGRCFKRPYVFSLCANMFSYGIGVLIQVFI